jgi:pimeloyl-ACP methyl ester carboxylesterase
VLLHAFPLSADQWLPQLHRVAPGCRYVAPDLRGFRGSGIAFEETQLDGVTTDDYAADVLELMSHLDIDQAVIAGLSMGGYVAFALLRRAPARVSGLVLADTRPGADSAEGRAARDAMVELVGRDGAAAVATQMLPKLLGETTQREQPDLSDAVRRLIELNTPEAIAAGALALKTRPDSTPLLSTIAVPTTILCGAEDVLTPPAESRAMQAAIAGSQLVMLPGAGHLSNLESAAAFSSALEHAVAGDR